MECGQSGAAADGDKAGRMVSCDLEAAEALAAMARCSTSRGGAFGSVELRPQLAVETVVTSQDQPAAAKPTKITSPEKSGEHTPINLCSTSRQTNHRMKFRRKLTEAEEEERKMRRVMANRESARQTIQRRQAMHLELTRKADDALEENDNLKKQRELMVDEYYSLKERNEFLKAQLAKVKKVAAGETEERTSSMAEKVYSGNSACGSSQIFLHNEPSKVPCFWPSIVPSSDVFPFQSVCNVSSSQIPCLVQGQANASPLFLVPVPWLLPLFTQTNIGGTNTHYCGKCSCSEARPCEDQSSMRAETYNQMQSMSQEIDGRGGRQPPTAIVVPGLFSPVRPREAPRSCQEDDSLDLRLVSAQGDMNQQGQSMSSPKKAEDVFVATEARRKRKELMRLKHVHCKQTRC